MVQVKLKRTLKQVIPFGIIWLISALVYTFLEFGILGDSSYYPNTGNVYNFKVSLIYVCSGSFLMGLIQGWIEQVWFKKLFKRNPLWVKVVLKSSYYLMLIILFLLTISVLANSLILDVPIFDPVIIDISKKFFTSFSFWSIVIYIGVSLNIALFFSEISEYLGVEILYNFLFGKYHKPIKEIRIFMFLDMKSSTTIAEKIGHEIYFELIKQYYEDMTDAILETEGEIYQYVGDEIVISWKEKTGLYKNNCIHCFKKIRDNFNVKENDYLHKYGLVPDFKAGYHIGEVTTGEIGIIKRDIIYTGDVLNTAARIQAKCNEYNTNVLISEELILKLSKDATFQYTEIGKLILRGKSETVKLCSINFD
ncbi:adenylate/guanylate cyclase domain-containing protein [Aquimarina pacifica]|uniref:adenylate/guanylate cyclase domain-containing protein n=1 Tax=Aquimarina pacifica TaxID=1296415 RepID=UPI0004706522|nr:adenylate/guanylate cyclase domain-containing protein [Aquimarina pacifica]